MINMRADTTKLEEGFKMALQVTKEFAEAAAKADFSGKTVVLPEGMEIARAGSIVEFEIDGEVLAQFLCLPKGSRVIHVRDKDGSWQGNPKLIVRVESPMLPPVIEGNLIPKCSPSFESEEYEVKGQPLMHPKWVTETRFMDWGLGSNAPASRKVIDFDSIPDDEEGDE